MMRALHIELDVPPSCEMDLVLPEEECEAVMAEWGAAWRDGRVIKLVDGMRTVALSARSVWSMESSPLPGTAPVLDADGAVVGEASLEPAPGTEAVQEAERCSE